MLVIVTLLFSTSLYIVWLNKINKFAKLSTKLAMIGEHTCAVAEESGGFCPCLPNINSKGETPVDGCMDHRSIHIKH